jgi:hypothetical protein
MLKENYLFFRLFLPWCPNLNEVPELESLFLCAHKKQSQIAKMYRVGQRWNLPESSRTVNLRHRGSVASRRKHAGIF